MFYPFYLNPSKQDETGLYEISLEKTDDFCVEVLPAISQGIQTVWRWGKEEKSRQNLNINIKAKLKRDNLNRGRKIKVFSNLESILKEIKPETQNKY